MYRSKKDVDKHVENLLSKLPLKEVSWCIKFYQRSVTFCSQENYIKYFKFQFNSRAYSVARLYFDVGDYANCQKYVELYLSQKHNNAASYKLLGQALQKMGQKEKALEQFKTSLNIDPSQTSLILESE